MSQPCVGIHQPFQFFSFSMFHLLLHGAHSLLHVQNVLLRRKKLLVNCEMSLYILILCQVPDASVLCKNYISGISGEFIHDNAEKRCLSGSVAADQSCFLPFFYVKRGILQNHFVTKGFADALTS